MSNNISYKLQHTKKVNKSTSLTFKVSFTLLVESISQNQLSTKDNHIDDKNNVIKFF